MRLNLKVYKIHKWSHHIHHWADNVTILCHHHSGVTYAAHKPPSTWTAQSATMPHHIAIRIEKEHIRLHTTSSCPVIYDDSSDAKKTTAFAISVASPNRPIGTWTNLRCFFSSESRNDINISVRSGPGHRLLNRIWDRRVLMYKRGSQGSNAWCDDMVKLRLLSPN